MNGKKALLAVLSCVYLLVNVSSVMAYELVVGKIVANLASATSNNKHVEWYVPFAPNVAATTSENILYLAMYYQLRDDSMVRGENQAANWTSYAWNPTTYSWISDAGGGVSRGSNYTGKYNWTGKLSKPMAGWNSSTNAVKFKIVATAKSGSSTTDTKYIWVVRSSSLGSSNQAYYRWMCSRYDRSALYKEMANAWRNMQTSPSGDGFKNAMDNIIDIGKEFVNPSASDLLFDLGSESISLLAQGSALASALAEVNGVLYQAIGWINTANNLLGPGLKDAIAAAVSSDMTKQAAGQFSSLAGLLDGVANAVRNDADAMNGVLYGGGSSYNWKQKMIEERDAINSAISNLSSGRDAIGRWLSGYAAYSNVGYGVGSGTYSAAQAVANKLYDFITGVENQLKVDKNLLDKMII